VPDGTGERVVRDGDCCARVILGELGQRVADIMRIQLSQRLTTDKFQDWLQDVAVLSGRCGRPPIEPVAQQSPTAR
jgi:hypothetical protein